jgi:ribosomal protein S12 methylthiotransferase accessory factor
MHLAGITRVPDITGLDTTGVPAVQCIRPDAQWGNQTFTVFGGKGESALQCRVSAIAEGIERFCAEDRNHRHRIVSASYRELASQQTVMHPQRFNVPASLAISDDEPLEWVEARRLDNDALCYVPACTVFYPYEPQTGRALLRYFTTGLAAGNDRLEALSHGLAEVIERDGAALNRIVRCFSAVDPATIDSERAQQLIRRFRDASLNIFIRSTAAPDIGVPVFSVILEDRLHPDPLYVSGGYGAHPDKEVALINALTEAGLSRSGTISGAREDLSKFQNAREGMSYEQFRSRYQYWFATEPSINYRSLSTYRLPTVADDLCLMAARVQAAGLRDVLWVDLGKPELQLSVVKVLVPGIERYSFKMTCIGQRAKDLYLKHHGRPLQT